MLSMLGKFSAVNKLKYVSRKQALTFHGESLHPMSDSVFWKNKKKIISLPSAEFAQSVNEAFVPRSLWPNSADEILIFSSENMGIIVYCTEIR